MMIGYSVNFLGAIVRYRSIILPFLIVPIVALINWQRIINIGNDKIVINHNVSFLEQKQANRSIFIKT